VRAPRSLWIIFARRHLAITAHPDERPRCRDPIVLVIVLFLVLGPKKLDLIEVTERENENDYE
jgi:hypothetical protein